MLDNEKNPYSGSETWPSSLMHSWRLQLAADVSPLTNMPNRCFAPFSGGGTRFVLAIEHGFNVLAADSSVLAILRRAGKDRLDQSNQMTHWNVQMSVIPGCRPPLTN